MEGAPFAWIALVLAAAAMVMLVANARRVAKDEVGKPWGWILVAMAAAFAVLYVLVAYIRLR